MKAKLEHRSKNGRREREGEKEKMLIIIIISVIINGAELQAKAHFFNGEKEGINHSRSNVENDRSTISSIPPKLWQRFLGVG